MGLVFRWSATPHPKGTGTRAPQFGGFISIYAYTLCHRTTKFDVVTHVGEVHVFWGKSPSQDSGVPTLPNLEGSPVFMPTAFNAERLNSAW